MGDPRHGTAVGLPATEIEDVSIATATGAVALRPAGMLAGTGTALGASAVTADGRPRRRVWLVKVLLLTIDLVAIATAMALAGSLLRLLPSEGTGETANYRSIALLSMPVWTASLIHYRLYSSRHLTSRLQEFRSLVHAAGASVMAILALSVLVEAYVPRGWLLLTFVLSVLTLTATHDVSRRTFDSKRRRAWMQRPVIIVGANEEGREVAVMLSQAPIRTYEPVGFVDDDLPAGTVVGGLPVLGKVDEVGRIAEQREIGSILVATTAIGLRRASKLAFDLTASRIHVELCTGLCDVATERLTVSRAGRLAVLYVEPVKLDGWRGVAKRAFDITVSSVALLVCGPTLLVAAVAIRLDSGGPVLFKQARLGRDGETFRILKLRTMVVDAEQQMVDLLDRNESDGPLFKVRDDPRITRVGKLLRKLSIDELPQLWNVIRGEMSLVGPRPAIPEESAGWSVELHERLRVRPGITGMWQVSGRSNASFDDYTRLDLYYVRNWSLLTDLAMLAKTVPTVIFGRGAS